MTEYPVKKSFFSFCVILEEINRTKREREIERKSTMNVF
jgi:hypothetical protein